MNSAMLHNIKKKNTLRRKLKMSPTSVNLKEKFKHLRATIKKMLRESRTNYVNSICDDHGNNPKRFWSLFKLKSKSCNVPEKVSMRAEGNSRKYAETPIDVANLFNNYFTSIFTTDPDTFADPSTTDDNLLSNKTNTALLDDVILTPDDVTNVLKTLDNNKAHGPDGIPARLLIETASQMSPSLCELFNKSLRTGMVPFDWKLANVVPVYKKGDQEFVENYRPISLLSLISKVLERCVFNNIRDHIYSQINPCQHGFVPGKNYVSQLVEVFDKIGSQLDRGKQIDVIYLDMSKAFDKVSHKRLLLCLREYDFGGNILNWFQSYLQDRRQQTTILGASSSPSQVTSGVPQGSILGPMLFLLYENDLPSSIKNSSIATYADDTKIFKEISNIGDAKALQEDLTNFESTSFDAGLLLNSSKCKTLRVTRKHHSIEYPYTLQDDILRDSENERDLGIWISNNLTWRKQVLEQCSKASKMLGFIKRSTRTITNCKARRTLYFTLVRSQMGYATQLWSPQTIDLISRLERVQRRASKYILDLPFICETSYKQRLIDLNFLPLSYWHEYLDMLFFYKTNCGIMRISESVLPKPKISRITRSLDANSQKFQIRKCKTSTYQQTYTIRTTRIWNMLPRPITNKFNSLTIFKKLLLQYYHTALELNYNVDDPRSWKTICLKCNQARDLTKPITCCF